MQISFFDSYHQFLKIPITLKESEKTVFNELDHDYSLVAITVISCKKENCSEYNKNRYHINLCIILVIYHSGITSMVDTSIH